MVLNKPLIIRFIKTHCVICVCVYFVNKEMTSQKVSWPWQLEHIYCSVLIDICQNSYCADIKKTALSGESNSTQRRRSGGLITLLKQCKCFKQKDLHYIYMGLES